LNLLRCGCKAISYCSHLLLVHWHRRQLKVNAFYDSTAMGLKKL